MERRYNLKLDLACTTTLVHRAYCSHHEQKNTLLSVVNFAIFLLAKSGTTNGFVVVPSRVAHDHISKDD